MGMDNLNHSLISRDPANPLLPPPPQPQTSATSAKSAETHLPQPGLTRTRTRSKSSERSSDELLAPDAAAALAGVHSTDTEMDGAGHRRRRSSLMNKLDTSARSKKKTASLKSPTKLGKDSIQEEPKSGDRERWMGEGNHTDDDRSTSEDMELGDMSEEEGLQDDEETGLTGKDKKRRKRKRRRNTLIDQRLVAEPTITAEEKKAADVNVVKSSLINGFLIGLWYLFSLSISIYNKWMFDPKHLDFHFPLFTTSMHMLVQFSLASLVLFLLPQFRPRYDSISNPHNTHGDGELLQHEADSQKPLMTKMFYVTRIGPCGMATGLDIGLGNMSLKFITLTFYTMCKSSALAFVLLFAFLFRLEVPSWRLVGIIATMTLGVIMMVAGEVEFSTIGFILIISAAFFSGFRWGLTQILLLRNPATSNPFSSIFYLAPIMFISLLVIAIPVEGFPALWEGLGVLVEKKGPILGPLLLLFPGVIAFCMTASEFALLQRTSVVTLSIAGIFKEVVTISAAGLVFHDTLTPINVSGLFVTIGAIAAYNYIKITKMRADARTAAHKLRHGDDDRSESDTDSEVEEVENDWARDGATYITSDGDILPAPSSFRVPNAAEGSRANGGPIEPTREEIERLAASKKELSD
ncbi:putative transporter [Hyphodiscus hymeniophilus]|uniref:Transporter n=1 Tax=Hyphodiscus hymeniophilus TaxID=353542 RepID=A0A9P6VMP9_9HELO|nr:putative transporter [Hyphodiscus hymeniophilus]